MTEMHNVHAKRFTNVQILAVGIILGSEKHIINNR